MFLIFAFSCVTSYATEASTISLVQKESENVKEICVDVVNNLFKLLWQRRNFYDDLKR